MMVKRDHFGKKEKKKRKLSVDLPCTQFQSGFMRLDRDLQPSAGVFALKVEN